MSKDKKYIWFHSGSGDTYREVSDNPSSFTSIPTIDLAGLDSSSLEDRKRIAKEIYDACHRCGFFYVKNHGIPQQVADDAFVLLKRFFALDAETKMTAHVNSTDRPL